MRKIIVIISVAATVIGCGNSTKSKIVSQYNAKLFETENRQFGYDIYKGDTLIIHQPVIPGAEGNKGFSSQAQAATVADLMITKLDNNIMPPSISDQELDSLKIDKK